MARPSPLLSGTWTSVAAEVATSVDLEASARRFGALKRKRKIRSAEALLRLALIWGPGRTSLREAALAAADAGIAELSDKAVEGRLRKMGDWLEHVLSSLLRDRLGRDAAEPAGLALSLIDGSVICAPGKGATWRLHARYDPAAGRFAGLVLTDARQAERADRTPLGPGRIAAMDRGYAKVRSLRAVLDEGSDFVARIGWQSLVLPGASDERIDLVSLLDDTVPVRDMPVRIAALPRETRLLIRPLPPEAAARQRARRVRKASKKSQKLDPRTAKAAGFLVLLTSLPKTTHPPEQVFDLYRDRWQVEIGFKRLKTLGRLDQLPSSDPVLARTWLLAQLIAAVLTDDIANEIVGFSPSEG